VTDTDEVLMRPGDTVIIRGTNHAWSNRSNAPCLMVGTMTDATPANGADQTMSELTVDACDCDVLVVGGGLVGLVASMFVAQQGLRVWLVERHAATSSHPKLRGVSARTMELYRSAGIEEAIRAAGENHFGVAIGDSLAGEYERIHLPLALARQNRLSPTTHYACDQDRMEPILLQRSAELGAQLFYGCTAVNIEQHESTRHRRRGVVSIHCRHAHAGRATESDHRRYLVAADGARGTIRASLGIGRHGKPVPGKGLSVLFDADLEPAMRGRRISAMVAPAEGALLFVRSDARDHNWFALTPRTDLDSIDPESAATEAIPMIRSVVGIADLDITIRSAMTWSTGGLRRRPLPRGSHLSGRRRSASHAALRWIRRQYRNRGRAQSCVETRRGLLG